MKKIKVLVVDDSALMRKIISDMINSNDDLEVIGIAKNGQDLLNKLEKLSPDVITLDVEMPIMDGMTALYELKKLNINVPVIVLSSVSLRGTKLTMDCLEAGAFDFLPKPSGAISLDIDKVKDELISKIRMASRGNKKVEEMQTHKVNTRVNSVNVSNKIEAVIIGASTGGPKALYKVVTEIPGDIGVPIFIVQHMPVGFTKAFAQRLNDNSKLRVVEAQDGDKIEKNTVFVAPGGYHMEVNKDNRIHLNTEPPIWGVRPAVDKLFISASQVYKERLLSIILTGMGKDGASGTVEVKKAGGITLAEHQSTCTIYGMPKAAIETGMVDEVLPINDIALEIEKLVLRR